MGLFPVSPLAHGGHLRYQTECDYTECYFWPLGVGKGEKPKCGPYCLLLGSRGQSYWQTAGKTAVASCRLVSTIPGCPVPQEGQPGRYVWVLVFLTPNDAMVWLLQMGHSHINLGLHYVHPTPGYGVAGHSCSGQPKVSDILPHPEGRQD